ncbi:MAG TPA: hypothetical protein PLW40_10670 [Syntrophales bacterium]|nr:hypothetical protein [Syntrophales bacterium]HOM08132.1 hypothetical protein [Syntrophales bacterium]HPQ07511.1 hypothetical protein [Syntrophales bacterium]
MNDEETAREFQRRRRKTFRMAMLFGSAALICLILMLLIGIFDLDVPFFVMPVLVMVLFVSWGLAILIVTSNYRCPRCNELPLTENYGELGGFELNPHVCPRCHARLK